MANNIAKSPRVAVPKIFEVGYRTAAKRKTIAVEDVACGLQSLNLGSEVDSDGVPLTPITSDQGKSKAVLDPVGTPSSALLPNLNKLLSKDNADTPTRYFAVGPISANDDIEGKLHQLNTKHGGARKVIQPKLISNGDGRTLSLLGACDDLRDVDAASTQAVQLFEGAQTSRSIPYARYVDMTTKFIHLPVDSAAHDAEVMIVAMYQGDAYQFRSEGVQMAEQIVYDAAINFANGSEGIVGMRLHCAPDGVALRFKLEFASVKDAKTAVSFGNLPCAAKGWFLFVKTVAREKDEFEDSPDRSNSSHNGSQVGMYTSPTGRSRWEIDAEGKQRILSPERIVGQAQMAPTPAGLVFGPGPVMVQPPHQAIQQQQMVPAGGYADAHVQKPTAENSSQVVNTQKILAGYDVRTTLMLRNIPNKLSCWDVKARLDEVAFGQFDFFYLRIDFAKDSNVGYGFVNFTDPRCIIKLMENLSGKPWIEGTKRMCQVSYATIQGIDCLRQKFRNSAIMEEAPDYRPKMFFTMDDIAEGADQDLLGKEKPFPPPDNEYKKARSMDNAAMTGLYPSKHLAQRQRAYHSQYDRGTPAQVREEQMGIQQPYYAVQPYYAPQLVAPQYGYHAGAPPTPGMHPGANHPRHLNGLMAPPMIQGLPAAPYAHHGQYAPVSAYPNGQVVYAMAPPQHGEWYPA